MSSANNTESLGTLQWDIIELANHLRQERLFVNSEQQNLQVLNKKVLYASSNLAQQAWITAQQRVNLNQLIMSKPYCTPASCCQRANILESPNFVDVYKYLNYQTCLSYGEFLGAFRKSPKLIALCLVEGDKLLPDLVQTIVQLLAAGLYGSCLLPEDKILLLKLLRHLMLLQIIPSDNPRRLLRHGTCAFSRLYSIFHESLFSAKFFLTAALHNPIVQLLMEDEMFLDIDPDKAPIRFPAAERLKKFGKEGTTEYESKLQRYRLWTVNSLFNITQRFITSIRENMHCFPSSICWLVRQMAGLLGKNGNVDSKEVHAMCTDLVFTYFICPAIVNPEPYGITDAPISYVARFNLMQVGQILQMLSLMKYQAVDSKTFDLYKKFDKDSISSIIDTMVNGAAEELEDEPNISIDNNKLRGLSRSAALFTETELNTFIIFLQTIAAETAVENAAFDAKQLVNLLSQLPSGSLSANKLANNHSVESTNKKGGLLGKGRKRGVLISPSSSYSSNTTNDGGDELNGTSTPEEESIDKNPQDVLVIPFGPTSGEFVGLLSEQKVLCTELGSNLENGPVTLNLESDDISNIHDRRESCSVERIESQEKKTRFSLSHDEVLFEGFNGNTSDNLEAVSEAASNHSVASSLELETEDQNDNLSDMVSASVSGRGTPNISGRDTPSSQMTEGEEGRTDETRQLGLPSSTIPTKQSQSEIDDKFCKFEIKKLIEGDETVSMVSDTWSTDVLASDSEIVEQQEKPLYPPSTEQISSVLSTTSESMPQAMLDVSETASEAWSTDVLASDSERLTEVDTDDTASVARSDDTARSEIEVEACSEAETTEKTLSQSIAQNVTSTECLSTTNYQENAQLPTSISLSPTTSPTSISDMAEQSRSNYSTITTEYIDKNANNIGSDSIDYGKTPCEGMVDLMDKLHIEDAKDQMEQQNSSHHNAIATAAVTPALLLANHISPPTLMNTEKSHNVPKSEEIQSGLVDTIDGSINESGPDGAVGLSTGSLASSSSSGSETRIKNTNSEIPRVSLENENCDVTNDNLKPTASSGAIPKSISFDMTAERGDKELLDDDQKNKRSFFGKLKMSLRNRRRTVRGTEDIARCYDRDIIGDGINVSRHRPRRIMSEDVTSTSSMNGDSTDDILAKYRRKPSAASDTASIESNQSRMKDSTEDERLFIDPNNVELSYAFSDAKRKLRMVLSTADLQHVPWSATSERSYWLQKENELVAFLQLQLAEAINLQDRALIAHLHETLRCVRLFNDDGCRKLFKSLREDYKKRSPYIAYLIRCRQGLLSTLAHLDRLCVRVKCDRDTINNHLVSVCVKVFLEKRESLLLRFCDEFKKLTLTDEKQDLVDNFLSTVYAKMDSDSIWQSGASENQLNLARVVVERTVMARVYHNALYPNGDGDVYRDQLLHDHIKKLAQVVTPNHKDLRIPKIYHYECPWPWAQAELAVISAYKTPRDKLQCVFRCATTIMNLLSMATERGVPAADDMIPVLVYVIIKTNPPSLLSTIQYVDSFYGNRLGGEEQYWWTQFCSAIEFIKTMD
ncbi:GTPase-activating protein and VPS9 domain-containing protein 1 isoform X1 [Ceratina calcarata]|uniref:Receptor-mediated endocytosis protein 6 homolog n=1 Tax=Ceratina calcarata TaxID=156304 RepID=A0AAJ7NBH1_9HYME|nr:GTPase-activating protein and VPS9 domain-containing protein 1 isoform X1 [Ceratina calcarata]XP_026672860.1 GTPase-activating protein and VPS9 domain-containing protein 1 isoform X1 [Ceratina calcarata]XP_026672861.1 GTPase-activating protein and VPS9 domain-containing protein 1 isoform X1 [Ceratina calcarata]XP_026672862.1 GTPase-activating protein and VPS9 domain-containing protein 1 isoform X1 [Ceratina calcarata]XP_026672864.1 GTPase-activating protein and VPS9 domain-containing protein